jgi:hypothetical protein
MSATDSWRITINELDESQTALPSTGNVGATVISSAKGDLVPHKIPRGNAQLIQDLYGITPSNYQVLELIKANEQADIWVSAPSLNGEYGGVYVTSGGTEPLTSGFSSTSSVDFEEISVTETLGTGDGTTVNFTLTLDDFAHYNNQTIDIEVDGTSINVSASDVATEVLSTTPDVGDGTLVRSTGALDFTFDTAPTDGQAITVTYTVDRSADTYFILFNATPQADDRAVQLTFDSTTNWFTLNLYHKNSDGTYRELGASPYTLSLTSGDKDGFGANIYIEDVLDENYYLLPVINTALTLSSFVDDSSQVDLAGGTRGDTITLTELTAGWAYFQKKNTYGADIFFDLTADAGIPTIFDTLRSTYQKYSHYILPLPNDTVSNTISTKAGYSISNRGVSFYYNWGYISDPYNNSQTLSNLMGRVFKKHAQMIDVYNGLAPSWIDENGHGGQLGGGIIKMVYDPSETELRSLDTARINPIVTDQKYGVMIVSQRTSLTVDSDYSWIAHSRTADYLISNILENCLPQFITKLNDVRTRSTISSLASQIVNPLLAPPYTLLEDAVIQCNSENNGPDILNARKLVLTVKVIFTKFAEYIVFNFVNSPSGTSLEE